MAQLPKQLQQSELSFILVYHKKKNPIESGWQTVNRYKYNSPTLINHLNKGGNVGIICGEQSDGLRILDDDTPNKELINLYLLHFGETFRVRDHLYFRFDNKESKKIIFNHPTKLYKGKNGKLTHHQGELQGTSTFCVTNPSTHPSGELYEIKKDLPIATISYDKFVEVFKEFIRKKVVVIRNHTPSSWEGDNITDIPLGNIISFNGLKDVGGGCYQGSHPGHGSSGGMNFRIDTMNNTWCCYRCGNSGGGASELIGVMEGIIDCSNAGKSCYTSDQAKEVIKIAREKYGLSTPTATIKDLGEVKGWANSISIVKFAKRHNLERCPKCNNHFRFTDSHGMFYCDTCKYGGGLKKFAELSFFHDVS